MTTCALHDNVHAAVENAKPDPRQLTIFDRCGEPVRARARFPVEWTALKYARRRCEDPTNKDFAQYGARGIMFCAEWCGDDGLLRFIAEVGRKPSPSHTLDRIDNKRGYVPGNVRWATSVEQANNRRSNLWVTWRGETHTAAEWGRKVGVRRQRVANAVANGEPLDLVLNPQATLADELLAAAKMLGGLSQRGCRRLARACREAARQLGEGGQAQRAG